MGLGFKVASLGFRVAGWGLRVGCRGFECSWLYWLKHSGVYRAVGVRMYRCRYGGPYRV